jgi:hypothetical protein
MFFANLIFSRQTFDFPAIFVSRQKFDCLIFPPLQVPAKIYCRHRRQKAEKERKVEETAALSPFQRMLAERAKRLEEVSLFLYINFPGTFDNLTVVTRECVALPLFPS